MATQSISQDLSDLLTTKNFDPTYLNKSGRDADPADAVTYSFDWTGPSGKNYGTLAIVLGDGNDMMVFFGDNLGRSMENPDDKNEWFKFLEQLSNFATQHRYTFSPKDLNRLKHTMAGIAAIKEGLFEGYYGTRRVSYVGEQTDARLVIKHNRMLGENDKRYRYVESLYIETGDGERFKLPFTKLAGGRAMLEHVRHGGKPYDIRGNHIVEMVSEINLLARFNRASHAKIFEGSTAVLVEEARSYYHELQENLKHLSSSRGYNTYFESWSPADIGSEDALVEDIKTLFVEQTLDARIESALPLLAKIQQGTAMKEIQVFENWVNSVTEGTWELPDTPQQQAQLQKLMSTELIVGPDGTNATEQLYDLVGDDRLFDLIQAAADADPNANCWDNAEIVARMGELGVDVSAITQQGAEQPVEQPIEQGVAEAGYIGGHNRDDPDYGRKVEPRITMRKGSRSMAIPPRLLDHYKSEGWVEVSREKGVAEGWQEDSQELEDWSKEVNKRLYRAHESQRPALAKQLSKIEQKNFGSSLNKGSLTQVVHAALMALQKGQMVHYDPQSVGSMPFGNIVGDDARVIANSGLSKYDVDGYRGLQRAGIVDNIEQFLHLRDLADNQGQAILKYANMPPVAAWMQFIKDIGWSKDDMNEEVQAKTDDKLLAYYAQRKAEKEKQQQGVAEDHKEHSNNEWYDKHGNLDPNGSYDAGGHCHLEREVDEGTIWGQATQDPMNYNAAVTGSYYESKDGDALLARIKSLALLK